jgi:hypothetical protein
VSLAQMPVRIGAADLRAAHSEGRPEYSAILLSCSLNQGQSALRLDCEKIAQTTVNWRLFFWRAPIDGAQS